MKRLIRITFWISLIIIISSFTVLAKDSGFIIKIPDRVVLPGPKVDLSQMGQIQGISNDDLAVLKKIDLGLTPLPGQVRTFTREYLTFILQQRSFKASWDLQMGKQVEVRVESTRIERQQLEKAITSLVTIEPNLTKRWVEIGSLPAEIWLNKGQWEIRAESIGRTPRFGSALFKIILSNGSEYRYINVSGRIHATAQVYRALHDLSLQAEIKQTDFEKADVELTNGQEIFGEFPANVWMTRNIKQGGILRKDQIQAIPWVRKNRQVKVVVRGGGFELNMTGIAKNDGWEGQEIMIVNPDSQKIFRGKVIAENTVEVNFR